MFAAPDLLGDAEQVFVDVTKGKLKDYYNLLIREKAKPTNIIQK